MSEGPSATEHELIERVLDAVEYVALVIELKSRFDADRQLVARAAQLL